MIDRPSRDRLAELIRHLVAGRISNYEFEEALPLESRDPAVWEVFRNGAWCLYGDLEEHRLVDRKRLGREARREAARWIVFLKSEREYEWPASRHRLSGWLALAHLAHLLTLKSPVGLLVHLLVAWAWARWRRRLWRRSGDPAVWPFLRAGDLEAARAAPCYLAGS